jgi:hypothetical protein
VEKGMQAAVWLSILVAVVILFGVAATGNRLRGFVCRKPLIEVCLVLLGLIQDLQLHRGLSGALLDRRKDFLAELDANELKLQRSLQAL